MDRPTLVHKIVKDVIDAWDPEGLLEQGAPQDEYDDEVRSIVHKIAQVHNYRTSIELIALVFKTHFEHLATRYSYAFCKGVGEKLFNLLKANKLVDLSKSSVNILVLCDANKPQNPPVTVALVFDKVVMSVPSIFSSIEEAQDWANNFLQTIKEGRYTVTMDSEML